MKNVLYIAAIGVLLVLGGCATNQPIRYTNNPVQDVYQGATNPTLVQDCTSAAMVGVFGQVLGAQDKKIRSNDAYKECQKALRDARYEAKRQRDYQRRQAQREQDFQRKLQMMEARRMAEMAPTTECASVYRRDNVTGKITSVYECQTSGTKNGWDNKYPNPNYR